MRHEVTPNHVAPSPATAGVVALLLGAWLLAGCAGEGSMAPESESRAVLASWVAAPGERIEACAAVTLDEAADIVALAPIAAPGTVRTTAWWSEPSAPDGPALPCGQPTGEHRLFDGQGELALPPEVALRVPAGKQLWVRAEVVNLGASEVAGESGLLLETTTDAVELADMVALAPIPGAGASCAMPADAFVFAVAPRIAAGARLDVVAESSFAGGEVALLSGESESGIWQLERPVALRAGEALRASCYPAEGVLPARQVDSHPLCEAAVYRFPAAGGGCR